MSKRPCHCDRHTCGLCARWYTSARHRAAWGGPVEAPPLPAGWGETESVPPSQRERAGNPPRPARPGRCVHLGVREEFTVGCNGWKCRHACAAPPGTETAAADGRCRPGVECQTCPAFEDDGPF